MSVQNAPGRRTLTGGNAAPVLDGFERIGARGFYRPVARVTFEQGVEMVAESMQLARELELTDLLVNTTALTGFPPPSVFARHAMIQRWLECAGSALRVALVARAEIIDPQKIAVLMLQNRGGTGDVFLTEAEALAWLDARLARNECVPCFAGPVRSRS